MTHLRLIIGSVLLALLPLTALAATNSDVEFRDCMRTVTINYQNRLFDVQILFNNRRIEAAADRRVMNVDSWNIEDDRTRSSVQRDIERNIRDRDRDADTLLRNDIRGAKDDVRNAERVCKDQLRARQRNRTGIL